MATFGVAMIAGTIEGIFGNGFGLRFGLAVQEVLAKVPEGVLELLGVLGGAYFIAKSGERAVTAHSTAKYDPPARAEVDDPDATFPSPQFGKE
jgi:hypothetical protein